VKLIQNIWMHLSVDEMNRCVTANERELWVCWVKPNCLPSKNVRILSFLKPSAEENFGQSISDGGLISGRIVAQEEKDNALKLYTELVARIGLAKRSNGKSLRELLKSSNGNSLWWYHPVSFKDCEGDPVFNRIIQILVVDRVVSEGNFEKIVLWGTDYTIAGVLKTKYRIECRKIKRKSIAINYLRAFGSRIKNFIEHIYHWYLIRKGVSEISCIPDAVFEGFWDWSVRPGSKGDGLDDRYFKALPNLLEQQGMKTAWLLWFAPHTEPRLECRSAKEVLNEADTYKNLIFVQRYLALIDIIKAFFNFSPGTKYLSFARSSGFRELFNNNRLNLFPLFRDQLSYHFMSATIPHHVLVEKAYCNAFMKFRPKIALTFLEMFPHSRAFYVGAQQGYPETKLATMQHASYSREKTFLRLDPEEEFNGKPDNCPIPKPDYVFAMGELGKEIFQECGFSGENIILTGSARYEHITKNIIDKSQIIQKKTFNLLMVSSLDREIEWDMIDAVCCASKDMPYINLYLRSHPFAPINEHPLFKKFKDIITITIGTLDEDLKNADLVIFSSSTVAEEALIKGVPVWQWCSVNYNGSVFRDVKVIPFFCKVSDLRAALEKFKIDPMSFIPDEGTKEIVSKKCFYKVDGKSAERIANSLISLISQ
jgi:surface carbohydrate biosynthesis protein (TIGR04326 family)